ncbi:MAG: hypothetical protein QG602_900 [Verrucomicrobiota bacterium]|nr:hypothetical protein [Verrucomicrobiota bacterium]
MAKQPRLSRRAVSLLTPRIPCNDRGASKLAAHKAKAGFGDPALHQSKSSGPIAAGSSERIEPSMRSGPLQKEYTRIFGPNS